MSNNCYNITLILICNNTVFTSLFKKKLLLMLNQIVINTYMIRQLISESMSPSEEM